MTRKLFLAIAGLAVVASLTLSTSARAAVVTRVIGGDVGEGLDTTGTFLHSVNIGLSGTGVSHTVNGLGFVREGSAVGLTVSVPGTPAAQNFSGTAPALGASSNDDAVEAILQTLKFRAPTTSIPPDDNSFTVGITNLVAGRSYKLQLLMFDSAGTNNNGRTFDVHLNGQQVVNDLDLWDLGASSHANSDADLIAPGVQKAGAVLTETIVATPGNTSINLRFTRVANSGVINAITVEDLGLTPVPEPSAAIMLMAFAPLLFRSRHCSGGDPGAEEE